MKKILNDKNEIMKDMLYGYSVAHKDIIKVIDNKYVVRAKKKEIGKVGVVVASGSGHEPCMIELVGEGLLDVNVAGNIFAAPSGDEVLEGIKLADNGAGVILLVSSHAGDIMNAKFGIRLAKAQGINAEMVILWDDVFSAPKGMEEERRGTCGLFFSWKIVSAAAEMGKKLSELVQLAKRTRDATRSLTVAIESGTHPETGNKMFELPEDKIEVGMGVHGEAGTGRMDICTSSELVNFMLSKIIEDRPFEEGDEVCVLVNNCGSMTFAELYIIYGDIFKQLEAKGIKVVGKWIGAYATTQEMAGFGISLIKVDEELLKMYDYKVNTILKYYE
ncbi:MAG: dihydroxyacetone kinase subunit DhaK [Spirochaetales bacterium]